jgi:hypothetical protein
MRLTGEDRSGPGGDPSRCTLLSKQRYIIWLDEA